MFWMASHVLARDGREGHGLPSSDTRGRQLVRTQDRVDYVHYLQRPCQLLELELLGSSS